MNGQPTPEQIEIIGRHVKGREVTDLGAGDLTLSRLCVHLGAKSVIAIDKEVLWNDPNSVFVAACTPEIKVYRCHFTEYRADIDVAVLAWPINHDCGLDQLVDRADVVIYLGKCTDGTMCGTPRLWYNLSCREVLSHKPDRSNTLIVYGPKRDDTRLPLLEERAGINSDRLYAYVGEKHV
jgi:hypothetical protein